MSKKQRREEAAVWENKRAKIESARTKRGLDADDAGADMTEISTAMAACSEICCDDSTDNEEIEAPIPLNAAVDDDYTPSMPVLPATIEPNLGHREKHPDSTLLPFPSLVAKSIPVREAMNIPKAKAALQSEWKKLWDMKCWDVDSVCE